MSGSTCLRDQRCNSEAATEFPWELRDAVDPDLKEGMGIVVLLCSILYAFASASILAYSTWCINPNI